jgi:putative transposase
MDPSTFYHVYNRANGGDNLFINEENYNFFLKRYANYINDIADTYAYCLMPNHFHLLLRMHEEQKLIDYFKSKDKIVTADPNRNIETFISKQFSNFFNSYTKSFNNTFERKGSLFNPNFKKKEIVSDKYLANVIHYIHSNPVHHGFVKNIEDWPHSSYHAYLLDKPTALKRKEVLNLFTGRDEFIKSHKQSLDKKILLEMDF